MTVKELIKELLNCDMDSNVNLKVSYKDIDDEFHEFEVEETYSFGMKNSVELIVDLEEFEYHSRFEIEE